MDITAENPVNLFDVAAPFIGLGRAPSDDEVSAALARALDGLRVGLEWKPGRM